MTRTFTVYGKIKGKGSARTFWLKDKKGNPIRPITTTHPETRSYESLIQEAYLAEYRREPPLTGALELTLQIYLGVPKSYSKKRKLLCFSNRELPTKKPDNSNVLKSIEDAISKGLAFLDDKQIVDHHMTKRYAETEMMIVEIKTIEVPDVD